MSHSTIPTTPSTSTEGESETPCVLRLDDLCIRFGKTPVVKHLSLDVRRGECLAILGESGSGKSVSASAIMNLIDCPPGDIASGEILFEGRDLADMNATDRRAAPPKEPPRRV